MDEGEEDGSEEGSEAVLLSYILLLAGEDCDCDAGVR